jgi:uncharacterized caspase-like protein
MSMPRKTIAALFALVPVLLLALAPLDAPAQTAAGSEKRIALVIGNAEYQAGALATPANDAGLIAQTLQAAGFDVVGARDLDQDSLRRAFRDFVDKATTSGPNTVAFIYASGYGLQLEGENYLVPIDAKIARDTDVAAEALRLSDYTRPLAALKLKASVVVLDAARANPFAKTGSPLAGGLALVEPDTSMLIAFNAAPGTVGPDGQGPYGPYAQALAEMLREGGLPLAQVFDRTRLRVNDLTKGGEVPWHAAKIETQVVFFERAPDAPPPPVPPEQTAAVRTKPIRELPAQEAYAAALDRDTMQGYSDFVTAYPGDPMVPRVRVIIAARREAIIWRRTRLEDTPPAYWSYLRRYPEGPHAPDAQRRLAFLAAALEPPPTFAVMAYDDVPPPPPEEIVYFGRPVLYFDDPVFAFAPPPPPPVVFLGPAVFVALDPPPEPIGLYVLPVPVWVRPPRYVSAPPANNIIFANVHNRVVVNNVTRTATVTNPAGQTRTITPQGQAGRSKGGAAPIGAAALGPSLPPSVAHKAALQTTTTPGGAAGQMKTLSAPGQPLPGMKGQPLPAANGVVTTAPTLAPGATAPSGMPKSNTTPGATPPAAKLVPPTPPSGTAATGTSGAPKFGTPAARLTTPPSTVTPSTATLPPPGTGAPKVGAPPAAAKLNTSPHLPGSNAIGSAGPKNNVPGNNAPAARTLAPTPHPPAANLGAPHPPATFNAKPVMPPVPPTPPAAARLSAPPPPKPPGPPPSVAAKPMSPQTFHPANAGPPMAAPRAPTPPPLVAPRAPAPAAAAAKGPACPPGHAPNGRGGCT